MALWKHLFGGILLAGLPVYARAESYLCQVQYFQKGTLNVLRSSEKLIDFSDFAEACRQPGCKPQTAYLSESPESDSEMVVLIAHQSKPPVVAAMLVYLKKNEAGDFEQKSLAGTDFGNRLYMGASSSETEDIFVECRFQK